MMASFPARSPQIAVKPWMATGFGTLFMFVTFTQASHGGASGYLINYTLAALICLIPFSFVASPKTWQLPRTNFVLLCAAILLASLSINAMQYVAVFMVYALLLAIVPSDAFLRNLPRYAYYAAVLNVVIYYSEFILVGQLGMSFDPTVFNYGQSRRDEIITTWGFSRYSGHQNEPGSFAGNLAALSVLSLLGDRRPTWFHWVVVLTLAMTLSLTAIVMATTLAAAIAIVGGVRPKALLTTAFVLTVIGVVLVQWSPLMLEPAVAYINHRLHVRDTVDGSIFVKTRLVEDLFSRGSFATFFGNRHESCDHCQYARSLGFGFYVIFQSGILGAAVLIGMAGLAVWRLGRRGIAVITIFFLLRAEFFFPQAVMVFLAIATMPRPSTVRNHGFTSPVREQRR